MKKLFATDFGQKLYNLDRKEKIRRAIATAIMLILVFGLFIIYSKDNHDRVLNQELKSIRDMTRESGNLCRGLLDTSHQMIDSAAKYSGDLQKGKKPTVSDLQSIKQNTQFDHYIYINRNGIGTDENGRSFNLKDTDCYKNGITGNHGEDVIDVEDVCGSQYKQLAFYAPFRYQTDIKGVLVGFYDTVTLTQYINLQVGSLRGISFLCDENGDVITATSDLKEKDEVQSHRNLQQFFAHKNRLSAKQMKEFKKAFKAKEDYSFIYREKDGKACAFLYQIPETNYILFQSFPPEIVKQLDNDFTMMAGCFCLALLGIVIIYVSYMMYTFLASKKRICEDRNNYLDVIAGITETFDYVGIFDLEKNKFSQISNEALEHYNIEETDDSKVVLEKTGKYLLHPDIPNKTMEEYFNREYLVSKLTEKKQSLYFEYYNSLENNRYKGLTIYCMEAKHGKPTRLLFAARDLSEHKQEEQKNKEELKSVNRKLENLAIHDALTGALNRSGFKKRVQELSEFDQHIGLVLVDLDKFKGINDAYGHETGDLVLKKLVKMLKKYFCGGDEVIRFGGDEFAVLVTTEVQNYDFVLEYIHLINEETLHPNDGLPSFSISVGAAFSNSGYSEDLYSKADSALYQIKENGRCGCMIYQGE